MNGNDYLADTNIMILLGNGSEPIAEFLQGKNICISFISEMELLSKPNITPEQIKIVRDMIDSCILIEMNNKIKSEAIKYRRKHRLKLPDAIVAATAKYLRIPLLTMDKDFKRASDIQLFHIAL